MSTLCTRRPCTLISRALSSAAHSRQPCTLPVLLIPLPAAWLDALGLFPWHPRCFELSREYAAFGGERRGENNALQPTGPDCTHRPISSTLCVCVCVWGGGRERDRERVWCVCVHVHVQENKICICAYVMLMSICICAYVKLEHTVCLWMSVCVWGE